MKLIKILSSLHTLKLAEYANTHTHTHTSLRSELKRAGVFLGKVSSAPSLSNHGEWGLIAEAPSALWLLLLKV